MIYVIGPVSGHEDDNRRAFEDARRELQSAFPYETVLIPHDVVPSSASWHRAMRLSVAKMTLADMVVRLLGWQDSRGARIESDLAEQIGIPQVDLDSLPEASE